MKIQEEGSELLPEDEGTGNLLPRLKCGARIPNRLPAREHAFRGFRKAIEFR